ncbi:NAD(P)-dependent oxidoreductase [Amycolatopsis sp. NPDC059027]|uniref:NAD(P)-dependent oxidoreductase n=1 Tax=unclassified Amycolatopsis TaxID=2618356 RepID=UPI003670CC2A
MRENTGETKQAVTVIGLGPMGKAMAGAFLGHGHPVTVWNRTASKADELVAKGATRAATIGEALGAAELVVLSLTDYDVVYTLLEPASESLSGKVIANLTSETPAKARAAAAWFAERGARQLTGGVMASALDIGSGEASTFYSGPRDAFEAHRGTLAVLTGTDYRGEDPGLGALYYQLQMSIFWPAALAYVHTLSVARAHGITAAEFAPYVSPTLESVAAGIGFYTEKIDAGEYSGEFERLTMGEASVDHVVRTAEEAGVDSSLPSAVLDVFRRGVAAGHGEDSFTSLVEVFAKA